jgi:hypothetical protein
LKTRENMGSSASPAPRPPGVSSPPSITPTSEAARAVPAQNLTGTKIPPYKVADGVAVPLNVEPHPLSCEAHRKDWLSVRMRPCVLTPAGNKLLRQMTLAPTTAPSRGSCQ